MAKRGEIVFQEAGCGECHSGPYFTDQLRYDLGLGRELDSGVAFDVPTLKEVWRTAPYLYDGRAVDLEEMLTIYNPADRHGRTSQLSKKQISELVSYLLSL
jgi:cytochrome c peroxidase